MQFDIPSSICAVGGPLLHLRDRFGDRSPMPVSHLIHFPCYRSHGKRLRRGDREIVKCPALVAVHRVAMHPLGDLYRFVVRVQQGRVLILPQLFKCFRSTVPPAFAPNASQAEPTQTPSILQPFS